MWLQRRRPRACSSGVPGDVNGDGYAELAVGEPGKRREAGAIHLFYGSATGVVTSARGTALDDQYIDQDSEGVPGHRQAFNRFGTTIRLGDFNGDGCADLATATFDRDISVIIVYGSPHGLVTATSQRCSQVWPIWTETAPPTSGSASTMRSWCSTKASLASTTGPTIGRS